MRAEQTNELGAINRMYETMTRASSDYWYSYSSPATWQFWLLWGLLLPLAALFLTGKKRC